MKFDAPVSNRPGLEINLFPNQPPCPFLTSHWKRTGCLEHPLWKKGSIAHLWLITLRWILYLPIFPRPTHTNAHMLPHIQVSLFFPLIHIHKSITRWWNQFNLLRRQKPTLNKLMTAFIQVLCLFYFWKI